MSPAQLLTHFDRINEAPDAIPRLRRFIFDLAVRGKLVEQDWKDEPASELLKRIQAEKDQLVKAGKIRESRSLISTNNLKTPYEIPSSWKWVPLGEVINNHLGGGTPSKNNSTYWGGDIRWASVKDVGKGKYLDETIDRITEAGLADSSSNLIQPGNLIVVTRMGLGKVSINRIPVAINQDLRALSLSSLTSINYYYIFFKTHSFNGTGLTVKGIKLEELMNIAFPLPPLAEQLSIVAKVDELMLLCDRLEAVQSERENRRNRLVAVSLQRLNQPAGEVSAFHEHVRFHLRYLPRLTIRSEHIQQLRQTILNLAVRGRLISQDPNDEPASELLKRIQVEKEDLEKKGQKKKDAGRSSLDNRQPPFALPTGWAWARFPQLGTFGRGKSKHRPRNDPSLFEGGTHLLVQTGDVARSNGVIRTYTGKYNDAGLAQSAKWPKGTLCITIAANIADSGILNFDACFPDSIVGFIPASEFFSAKYFEYFLRTAKANLLAFAPATAQKNINLEILSSVLIPLPPLAEQDRIITKVDELMNVCNQLDVQLTTAQTESRRLLEAVLHEALNPVLSKKNIPKIGPAALEPVRLHKSAVTRRPNRHFLRAVLSAEIVYQLHVEPTFGRIKHQKILHLCEHVAQINGVAGEYRREAAGPLDNKMIYSVEAELKKQRWYEEYRRERFGHAYRPLEKAGGHRKYLERYWPDKLPVIQRLLEMMRTWDTDRCEIFSTTYAAWNDLLIWKKEPTDEAILKEILERWHERKQRIPEERWRKTIAWMRKEGFVPTGFGKPTR